MKKLLSYLVAGIVGGVPGGMGMGGGTLLIPILSFFKEIDQHTAQSVNLIAFIPMAVLAITVHAKNGLIEKKGLFAVILPALALGVTGSFFAGKIQGEILRKIFGGFMIALAIFIGFIEKNLNSPKSDDEK